MPLCECGCGTEVKRRYASGHHWRAKRIAAGVPDTKDCEWCGEPYGRDFRQTLEKWLTRRFCSNECRFAWWGQPGEKAHVWKGDAAKAQAGRVRAQKLYPDGPPCEVCGTHKPRVERHHKDGNTLNNDPSNIAFLCPTHHAAAEDRRRFSDEERLRRNRESARRSARRYRAKMTRAQKDRLNAQSRERRKNFTPEERRAWLAKVRVYNQRRAAKKRQ